ncbi:MAG TPA: indolepyruvate ferredoxin oxidoreductase subunit alpha, partial [Feifaniaceae bacterium]|nr:indolepyruvate ferredoxin oxidoreductase subunit alpha [Feifaniaceae bacterium]
MIPIMKETKPGTGVLAYGYEAVARGALEADVRVVSGYPGTPSSGALAALASVAEEAGIHVEWATNERVAMETAWGAASNGMRAMCTVNHLGTNVIVDALKYTANYGVRGGLVLFAGDDVGANTSAIESDSRVLAESADLPILCPSSAEEARVMTKYAFSLSESLGCPVLVRSVCQLMMQRSLVPVGSIERAHNEPDFAPNPRRVVMFEPGTMPAVTIHRYLHQNLAVAAELLKQQGFDREELQTEAKVGILCCGELRAVVHEAMERCGVSASVLQLGVIHPLDESLIAAFAKKIDTLIVAEEGEAFVELRVQALLGKRAIATPVVGRLSGDIPFGGELFTADFEALLRRVSGLPAADPDESGAVGYLAERGLTLCAGCAHMGVFYAIRKALEEKNGGRYVAFSDAGCAFMGILTPAKSITSATNMGGAISFASGVAHSGSKVPALALCGDGGFLHGGISALANAVFNQAQIVVLLLDNGTLGNTGLQPTGCTGTNAVGKRVPRIDLEGICRSMGVPFVTSVQPLDVPETMDAILEALDAPKPAVIIAKEPCVLNRLREEKAAHQNKCVAAVDSETCTRCGKCMELYCS